MEKFLLVFLVFVVHSSFAQYCGTSGPSVCTTGGLTAPGITNYTGFPCVEQNQNFNEVIQVYFPSDVSGVSVNSITIDSITNLPCGLCWSCDNASMVYAGGTQACIRVSGVSNDGVGTYQLKMYGTANTSFGPLQGSLESIGFQFFLQVIPAGAGCTTPGVINLLSACSGIVTQPVNIPCNIDVNMSAINHGVQCNYDSATVTLLSPVGNGYSFEWYTSDWSQFPPVIYSNTTNTSTTFNSSSWPFLTITDTTGCQRTVFISYKPHSGAVYIPDVCYATYDTSQNSHALELVFQRDNWFGNIAKYILKRQDLANEDANVIGVIDAADEGRIIDYSPNLFDIYNQNASYVNSYSITGVTACGDTVSNTRIYEPVQLTLNGFLGQGYPYLQWKHSNPIVYDTVFIFSRQAGESWRLRLKTVNINDTTWVDMNPDSTAMEYILGFSLTTQCDPSRSSQQMIFTNLGSASVDSALVDTTQIVEPTGMSQMEQNRFVFYPNPTESTLYVQLANTATANGLQAVVYNTMGQIVVKQDVSTDQINKLNVESLTPGIYMIGVQGTGYTGTMQKFVKK